MQELAAYSTVVMTLGLVVTRPRLGARLRLTPAAAAFAGVLLLLVLGAVKADHLRVAVTSLWSPFVAIGSVMVMTEVAQRVGLLDWWATRLEASATTTGGLFVRVFGLGVLTSASLNNDAAILLVTPVVVALVRRRYPQQPALVVPFAFAVFLSAGVAALPVSNPMNMVVSQFCGIGFNAYVAHMLPVALAGWAIAFLVLRGLFARELATPMAAPVDERGTRVPASRAQWLMMGLLGAVLLAYPTVGALGGPVWAVASTGALASLVLARRHTEDSALRLVQRGISWQTLAFLLAVLVMSLGLRDVGLVARLESLYAGAGLTTIGVTSAIGSALLNNHPMSYLNMMALGTAPSTSGNVYAALVGGDLGPRLLPMGSLAGLLWLEMLRRNHVEIGLGKFVRVGLVVALPTIAASLAILALY